MSSTAKPRKRDQISGFFRKSPSPLPARPKTSPKSVIPLPLSHTKTCSDIFADALELLSHEERKTIQAQLSPTPSVSMLRWTRCIAPHITSSRAAWERDGTGLTTDVKFIFKIRRTRYCSYWTSSSLWVTWSQTSTRYMLDCHGRVFELF